MGFLPPPLHLAEHQDIWHLLHQRAYLPYQGSSLPCPA